MSPWRRARSGDSDGKDIPAWRMKEPFEICQKGPSSNQRGAEKKGDQLRRGLGAFPGDSYPSARGSNDAYQVASGRAVEQSVENYGPVKGKRKTLCHGPGLGWELYFCCMKRKSVLDGERSAVSQQHNRANHHKCRRRIKDYYSIRVLTIQALLRCFRHASESPQPTAS